MLRIQEKLTHSFFALLSLPATAMGFALSVQIAALSWILSTQYGLEIHDVGLVWAAGPIAGILGQVIIGVVSDNVWFWKGRRRPFILIGGVLASLMLLALPSIDVLSTAMGFDGILTVAIVVALTLDLAINVSFNPTRSVIADVTPEGVNRTKGYTWMQTISGFFGVLAYLISVVFNNYILIYTGAVVVLLFSILPPFFIEEPRELRDEGANPEAGISGFSLVEIIKTIEPLWGFLLYAVYGMTLRLARVEVDHYYAEYACLALTLILMVRALMTSEAGLSKEAAGAVGFKKVLAAHAFTWIGVQTMFIYLYAYVQDIIPGLTDDQVGDVISWSFLVLNTVGFLLPVLVLEPITERLGRVKTHMGCMAIMAVGYAGILFFGFTPLIIYGLMAIVGVGWAATVSLPFAIMSQKIDQTKMGLYMGLFNLSVVLPQLMASLGVGRAVSRVPNKSLIFIICAVSLAISAAAWLLVKEDEGADDGAMPPGGGGH